MLLFIYISKVLEFFVPVQNSTATQQQQQFESQVHSLGESKHLHFQLYIFRKFQWLTVQILGQSRLQI